MEKIFNIKPVFILALTFLMIGCEQTEKNKDKNSFRKKISSLFKKKIPVEFIDSLYLEKFITHRKDFSDYKNRLHKFYSRRNYQLAWSKNGEFIPQATMFANLVKNTKEHGVDKFPDENLRQQIINTEQARKPHREEVSHKRKDLDILLTAYFFQYAREIWGGKVDPEAASIEWKIERKKIKFGKMLDTILSDNKNENPFLAFEPLHKEYNRLKNLLVKYKTISNQGGWGKIKNVKLKKGDTSNLVISLRKRLYAEGEISNLSKDSIFDFILETGLKKFQNRNGLKDDGILSSETIKTLNIPVEDRIKQIIVNMERWRWVPDKINGNYIWINIPEFKLHLFESDKEIFSMNVIVGKAATHTPIFNDEIEYIVMSPSWNVPEKIKMEEMMPLIKSDTDFFAKHDIEVLINGKSVEPSFIDWNSVSEKDFEKIHLRQKPGLGNALGNMKFLFPNEFEVYLHDTPEGHLFSQTDRGFSHGCIRIEKPEELAEYLLREENSWSKKKIYEAMLSETEQYIKLKKKMPVYIVYFTVWVDKNGVAQFRNDLYRHDQKLAEVYFSE